MCVCVCVWQVPFAHFLSSYSQGQVKFNYQKKRKEASLCSNYTAAGSLGLWVHRKKEKKNKSCFFFVFNCGGGGGSKVFLIDISFALDMFGKVRFLSSRKTHTHKT